MKLAVFGIQVAAFLIESIARGLWVERTGSQIKEFWDLRCATRFLRADPCANGRVGRRRQKSGVRRPGR